MAALPVARRRQGSLTTLDRLLPVKKEEPRTLVRRANHASLSKLPRRRHTLEPQLGAELRLGQLETPSANDLILGRCKDVFQGASREPSLDVLTCKFALKYKLPHSEVHRIMSEIKSARQNEHGGIDRQEFDKLICRLFDIGSVDEQVSASAYRAANAQEGIDIEQFLVWYRQNMFNTAFVSDSDQLVYDLAQKFDVSVAVVDKAKVKFDYYDLDKSGWMSYEEFENMFCSILKTKNATDLNPDRLKRFWQEIDHNSDGKVDFPEFTRWYLKYFNPDEENHPEDFDMAGPLRAFYDSYDPTLQRRNSLRGLARNRTLQ